MAVQRWLREGGDTGTGLGATRAASGHAILVCRGNGPRGWVRVGAAAQRNSGKTRNKTKGKKK